MEQLGITIEFMGKTLKFDKNVANIEKAINILKKGAANLNKELKLDPSNIVKISEKFKNLKMQEKLARDEMEILLAKLQQLNKNNVSPFSEEFTSTQKKIQQTEDKIVSIQKQTKKLTDGFRETDVAVKSFADKLGEAAAHTEKIGNALKPVSKAAQNYLVGATNAAIDFEDAFADVQKTVEETRTTSYEDLSRGLRDLAKEVPVTADRLSHIAGLAGQMGVKADDIVKFTEAMVKFGDSTNITAEEATTDIAQIYNVIGKSGDFSTLDNLLATIVDLGNNTATTEKDIVTMYRNIAAASSRVGMNEQQMAALAATLSSLGLDKGGASSISRIMTTIDKAVDMNADSLEEWANVAGLSVGEFKKVWNEDASAGLLSVVQGIAKMSDEGQSMNVILDDLDVKELRQIDTLSRLTNASDAYAENIARANKAYDKGSALNDEAAKRYKTVASQLKILKNNFVEFSISIGEIMLPYIRWLVDSLKEISDWLNGLQPHTKVLITRILAIVAALAPLLLGASKMLAFSKSLATNVKLLGKGINVLSTFMSNFGGTLLGVLQSFGTFVASHAGWIAIIVALGLAFKALYDNCEPFRKFVNNLIQRMKDLWNQFMQTNWIEALGEKFGWIGEIIGLVIESVKKLFDWMGKLIGKVFEFLGLKDEVESSGGAVGNAVRAITALDTSGMRSGGMMSGSITLNNSFTVTTNNVTEGMVRSWANTITDQINENLGRMV